MTNEGKTWRRRWREPLTLVALAVAAAALWVFLGIADEVGEGETRAVDEALLLAFRHEGSLDDPLGPLWFEEFARDITALGSIGVLSMVVVVTAGYLLLMPHARTALFVLAACGLGLGLSTLLKRHFDRPRPDLVAHGMDTFTASFPSGHAMLSAVVYLTLGTLLARLAGHWRQKVYIMTVAALLALMVGVSRVYLGVHWPSDVVAGWAAGAAWALGCWALADVLDLERRWRRL